MMLYAILSEIHLTLMHRLKIIRWFH